MKRTVQRPWGRRRRGGWVISKTELLEVLKKGQAIELNKVTVGTEKLRKLVNLLPYEDVLVRADGRLEVETITGRSRRVGDTFVWSYRKPKHYHQFFGIFNGGWVPRIVNTVVVLKPRKF